MNKHSFQWFVKRAMDLALATTILLSLLPLLLGIWLAVRWMMGKPVLFRQRRPGLHGRPFVLYKFRTMSDDRDPHGVLKLDAMRMTPLGRLLRRMSLDELPQLWNVIRGELSLVGPRPLLMEYLERYSPVEARRLDVPPGITGWAQVNGRNSITWEEKFAFDVWYVDNWSLWLDFWILFLTVVRTIRGQGISADGHATMPEFMGSAPANKEVA